MSKRCVLARGACADGKAPHTQSSLQIPGRAPRNKNANGVPMADSRAVSDVLEGDLRPPRPRR